MRLAVLVMMFVASTATAQPFERVLIPVVISGELPGAFGSRWVTRLAVTNTADQRVNIFGYNPFPSGCVIAVCPPVPSTPPNETFFPMLTPGQISQGAIMVVDSQFASKVRFQLRVQDVSRDAQTWGTEIPVMRSSMLASVPAELLDVPLTTGFRDTLRVYDIDALGNTQVTIRFFKTNPTIQSPVDIVVNPSGPMGPDVLLGERTINLSVEHRSTDPTFDLGYAELDSIETLPELQGVTRVRIEIQPVTPGLRPWGLISVTNDETQHVTVVTPQ